MHPPAFVQWVFFGLAALWIVGGLCAWSLRRARKKFPLEQRIENLRRTLRTGTPNVRGHLRIAPGDYPGISTAQAEQVAREEGFLRQTHGTRGLWLFYRAGTTPGYASNRDFRGGPPVEQVRESLAAQRAARSIRESAGFDPLDAATVEEAEEGLRKAHTSHERLLVRGALCAVPGVPVVIGLVAAWANGSFSVSGPGDVIFIVVAHALGVTLLPGAFLLFKRSFTVRREGRERYGPALAAYGEVVAAWDNEQRNR